MTDTPPTPQDYPTTTALRKVRGKGLDNPSHVIRDWLQRSPTEPSLAKRWLEGKVAVHLHLRIRSEGGELENGDLCLAFYPASVCDFALADDSRICIGLKTKRTCPDFAGVDHEPERWMYGTMLVNPVDPVEDREGMVFGLPAFVRLSLLDGCTMPSRDALEPIPRQFFEAGGRGADRELRGAAVAFSVEKGELADEVVEGAPQVVGKVSEEKAESQWRLPFDFDGEDILAAVRPELGFDYEGLALGCGPLVESGRLRIEDVQMLVCPLDFGPWAAEAGTHGSIGSVSALTNADDSCERTVKPT